MIDLSKLRHQATIYRPSATLGNRGQRTGSPTVVLADVPCGIETLSGLELIRARKQFAEATHRVELFGDPDNQITPRDYLVFGTRTLHVGAIIDNDQLGIELELLCKEEL